MKIGIINYGAGNINKVLKAVQYFHKDCKIINNPSDLKSVDKIILPGQGAYQNAINNLKLSILYEPLINDINQGKPILSICLGMQLLFKASEEFDNCHGLNIFSARVKKLKIQEYSVPIIGWYKLVASKKNSSSEVFDIKTQDYFYFAHSMFCDFKGEDVSYYVMYGDKKIPSVIQTDNIFATQFHPELSSKPGLRIIQNFINI